MRCSKDQGNDWFYQPFANCATVIEVAVCSSIIMEALDLRYRSTLSTMYSYRGAGKLPTLGRLGHGAWGIGGA